jgi:hypothetical protein
MAIEVEIPRRLFTVEEYHRMAEVGIFHPGERVELIEGEIVQMSPIGPRHAGCVINATRLFITRLGERAVVSPQNPVVIQPRSEPQPDLLLLRPRTVSYSVSIRPGGRPPSHARIQRWRHDASHGARSCARPWPPRGTCCPRVQLTTDLVQGRRIPI